MDIETRAEKLKQALKTCASIMQIDGAYDITYKDNDAYLTLTETVVTLSFLDSRLPLAIDAMLQKRHSRMMGPEPIQNTLYYWADPYKVKADAGKHVLKNLFGIDSYNSETGIARIAASGYELHRIGAVEYVDHTRWGLFSVLHDELETHFPGWLQRFNIARGIGMEEEHIAAYVFEHENVSLHNVANGMPDITF